MANRKTAAAIAGDAVRWPLLPYQIDWVEDESQVKVCAKGRRIGLSWTEAYDDSLYAYEGRGNIYYQSYSLDNARGFIDDCNYWFSAFFGTAFKVAELSTPEIRRYLKKNLEEEEVADIKAFRIDIPRRKDGGGGKEIVALTSSPRQFRSRGRPGDRGVLDEAAFTDNVEQSIKAVLAFTMWGGAVRVISTHNGIESGFNQLIERIKEGRYKRGKHNYSLHTITFTEAVAQGLTWRQCEVIEAAKPAAERKPVTQEMADDHEAMIRALYAHNADEELECIPAKSMGAFFDMVQVRAAKRSDAGNGSRKGSGAMASGCDLARTNHQWVNCCIEKVERVVRVVEEIILPDASKYNQDKTTSEIFEKYPIKRLAGDQVGLGEGYIEGWQEQRPGQVMHPGTDRQYTSHIDGYRVMGIKALGNLRFELADRLKGYLESGLIEIPDDPDLIDEFGLFRTVKQKSGQIGLHVIENRKGHGDRVWALIFALAAMDDELPPLAMMTGGESPEEMKSRDPIGYAKFVLQAMKKRAINPRLPQREKRSRRV